MNELQRRDSLDLEEGHRVLFSCENRHIYMRAELRAFAVATTSRK